jgi:hypothetical protein
LGWSSRMPQIAELRWCIEKDTGVILPAGHRCGTGCIILNCLGMLVPAVCDNSELATSQNISRTPRCRFGMGCMSRS